MMIFVSLQRCIQEYGGVGTTGSRLLGLGQVHASFPLLPKLTEFRLTWFWFRTGMARFRNCTTAPEQKNTFHHQLEEKNGKGHFSGDKLMNSTKVLLPGTLNRNLIIL